MVPDYPHKFFNDERWRYVLLMLVLAMDSFIYSYELLANYYQFLN